MRRPGLRPTAALLALLAGCGGGATAPSTTSSPAPGGASGSGITVTLTAGGASPKTVEVTVGSRVTFVNQDSVFHEVSSDPHPTHTDCAEINAAGALAPGQSRQTAPMTAARTCGFHDHGQPKNAAFQGRIVVR